MLGRVRDDTFAVACVAQWYFTYRNTANQSKDNDMLVLVRLGCLYMCMKKVILAHSSLSTSAWALHDSRSHMLPAAFQHALLQVAVNAGKVQQIPHHTKQSWEL